MLYKQLAEVYSELESTSKRLKKTYIIANFLKNVSEKDIEHITYLIQGLIFPLWEEKKIGFSTQLMQKAIASSTGSSLKEVEGLWKKTGDLGLVAEDLSRQRKQKTLFSKELTTKKVFDNLRTLRDSIVWCYFPKLEKISNKEYDKLKNGKKLKVNSLEEIKDYENYELIETEDEKNAREIYNFFIKKVQKAYDLCNDFSLVTKTLVEKVIKGLDGIKIKVHTPIQVMLPIRVENLEESFKDLGGKIQIEQKFDGFRVEVHYDGKKFSLFTRRLENVKTQFSELIPILKKHVSGKNYILDTEVR